MTYRSTPALAIVDTRLMTVSERTAFFTAFAQTLLRKNRGPLRLSQLELVEYPARGEVRLQEWVR